jgi:4a-hydroxytetrahydrobiopterin dehydratase
MSKTPTPLTHAELHHWLKQHPGWAMEGPMLVRTFEAESFLKGIAFVTEVGKLAEALDHHPDIDIRWRRVTLRLVTHDAGNQVSHLDTRLAGDAELVFAAATATVAT